MGRTAKNTTTFQATESLLLQTITCAGDYTKVWHILRTPAANRRQLQYVAADTYVTEPEICTHHAATETVLSSCTGGLCNLMIWCVSQSRQTITSMAVAGPHDRRFGSFQAAATALVCSLLLLTAEAAQQTGAVQSSGPAKSAPATSKCIEYQPKTCW